MGGAVEFFSIETVGVLAFCLGVVQGDISMLGQCLFIIRILGEQGNTDADGDNNFVTIYNNRLACYGN